eukprot:TRINITY_DN6143_c0_g1_i7.p2 TRINITY_DN6143_c0_g1~~TRINITY_DN6143_c0_g1_i7.p2  ORF type:complete len:231 (+),score=52.85 TRINITY_DN6143_c0_g1_i7:1524-2216(+)
MKRISFFFFGKKTLIHFVLAFGGFISVLVGYCLLLSSIILQLLSFFVPFFRNTNLAKKFTRENKHDIFFYGTLKRGFHWNAKYLYSSQFVCQAKTCEKFPLVIGQCGVPYVLDERGKGNQIVGEIWRVSDETLQAMDEYEGLRKGYYSRKQIHASTFLDTGSSPHHGPSSSSSSSIPVFIYVKSSFDSSLLDLDFISEYTLEHQKNLYQPIRHIQVKQRRYLGLEYELGH